MRGRSSTSARARRRASSAAAAIRHAFAGPIPCASSRTRPRSLRARRPRRPFPRRISRAVSRTPTPARPVPRRIATSSSSVRASAPRATSFSLGPVLGRQLGEPAALRTGRRHRSVSTRLDEPLDPDDARSSSGRDTAAASPSAAGRETSSETDAASSRPGSAGAFGRPMEAQPPRGSRRRALPPSPRRRPRESRGRGRAVAPALRVPARERRRAAPGRRAATGLRRGVVERRRRRQSAGSGRGPRVPAPT